MYKETKTSHYHLLTHLTSDTKPQQQNKYLAYIMTTTASGTAPIKWAQRADSLYLTIALAGTLCINDNTLTCVESSHRL